MTYKQKIVLFLVAVVLFGGCTTWMMLLAGEKWYMALLSGLGTIIAVIVTCVLSEKLLAWAKRGE